MNKNEGYISLAALLAILIFVVAIFLGLQNIFFANYVLVNKNIQLQKNREEIYDLIDKILVKMQNFILSDKDYEGLEYYQNILYEFSEYNVTINDISSALNINFISNEDLQNPIVQNLLFLSNKREDFIKYRNSSHFFEDYEDLKNYLNPEFKDSYTLYGWINNENITSYGFGELQKKYGSSVQKDYFPLVNKLPQMNIHFMNKELLKIIVSNKKYKIPDVHIKLKNLLFRLERGEAFSSEELAHFFEIPSNNPLFSRIGTKTNFWQINFVYNSIPVSLIVAGIPKDKNSTIIDSYILIDRRILFENRNTEL